MKSIKISNYENLKIWLEILLKIKSKEKYQNLNLLRTPKNLAGNPFKNESMKISNFGSKLSTEIGYF